MPVKIRKVDGYRVSTPHGVKAKHTSKKKAMSQQRLLNAVEHNPNFKPHKKKKSSSPKSNSGYAGLGKTEFR
jgi:hypothetical protein